MSLYVPPELDAVDFALTTHTVPAIDSPGHALQSHTPPSLDAVEFSLVSFTPPTYMDVGWELLPAGGTDGTASLTGATSTLSAGTIVAAGDASAVMTGTGTEFSAGTITATGNGMASVNGQTATVTVGEVVASGESQAVAGGGWFWFSREPRRRNGRAYLRGSACHASAGRITSGVSVLATLQPGAIAMRAGIVAARGIQNPTDEQLLAALELMQE